MLDYTCPTMANNSSVVTLGQGSGGRSMQELIDRMFAPLYTEGFAPDHDGAVFDMNGRVAFTTDSYVVKPLFFPGGNIGKLAVYGTVNDLAMCGAKPLYLSCSFILEEGLSLNILEKICASIASAAKESNVFIVTGDTKVVGRGQADGIYVNTSGVGIVPNNICIHPRQISEGDQIILSGDIGRHGIAVMLARENFNLHNGLESDCAPLATVVQSLLSEGFRPRCMRDLTRGGLAAALHEIADTAKLGIEIKESSIPIHESVRGACEIFGFDPVHVANEGRFIAIASKEEAGDLLAFLRLQKLTSSATLIGEFTSSNFVETIGPYGTRRILPPLSGELLPRIC